MSITNLSIKVSNPQNPKMAETLEFLVDSGAVYSVVPSPILKRLGILSDEEREFILANGQKVSRRLGGARFEYAGKKGHAPVIFGERKDSTLLGATSLEAMGLILNPLERNLLPLPMVLG